MNFADEIKNRVTMPDLMRYYGFALKAGNRLPCPIHGGKNNSMGLKKDFCHCFKCGFKADVIGFVQTYFGLSFQDALVKINADFNIGLPIGEKMTARKQIEIGRIAFERKRKQEERKKERQQVEDDYLVAFDEWKRLNDDLRNYAPKSSTEPLHPLFVEALKNIASAEYNLSCAEIARYEYESRNR